ATAGTHDGDELGLPDVDGYVRARFDYATLGLIDLADILQPDVRSIHLVAGGCSEMAFPRSRSAWEGLPPEGLLFCEIWGLGQEFIREIDIDVGLTLQLGIFLQKILRLLPVLASGPADRLVLGFLGVQDRHGAVDLQQ